MDASEAVTWPTTLTGVWQAVLFVVAGMGLAFWVLGRWMAPVCCAAGGLAIGAVVGAVVPQLLQWEGSLVIWVAGSALLGCVLAWLLFRLWMGMSVATILAVVTPMVALTLMGNTLPIQPGRMLVDLIQTSSATPPSDADQGQDMLTQYCAQQWQQTRATWENFTAGTRQVVILSAGAGGLAGMVIGLVGPFVSAAVGSAFLGAGAAWLCARALLAVHAPAAAGWIDTGPAGTLTVLGLITLVGVVIQWIISTDRTDKD